MPHECTLNRAFRLAGTNFGHLSSFAAADATSAFDAVDGSSTGT